MPAASGWTIDGGRDGELGLEPAQVLAGDLERDRMVARLLVGKLDRQAVGVVRPLERTRVSQQLDVGDLARHPGNLASERITSLPSAGQPRAKA